MITKKTFLGLCFILGIYTCLLAQEIQIEGSRIDYPMSWKGYNKIQNKGEEVKYNQSENTFKLIHVARHEYERAVKSLNTSRVFGYASLAAIPVGLLIIDADSDPRASGATYIGAIIAIIGTPVFGIVGLLARSASAKHQKQSIRIYNGLYEKYKDDEPSIGMTIGLTANGIGLVVNF